MQVRLKSFTITPDDRRAIRFHNDKRKTQASREECKAFFMEVIQRGLADVRYRWNGTTQTQAELAGAAPGAGAVAAPTGNVAQAPVAAEQAAQPVAVPQ